MTPHKLAGMFWLCKNVGQYWEPTTLDTMEKRLILKLNEEIETQKKLEGDLDVDVPEGLQLWNESDLDSIL
jgi:hypothetical protein